MSVDPDTPVRVAELLEHEEFVRALARRLLSDDAHGAEDLAQDVWRAALERPPASPARIKGWLRSVARNLNASRMRRHNPLYEGDALGERPSPAPTSSEKVEVDDARLTIARAVNSLRDPYRDVVLLRFYEDLPPRDIARRLDRPVETVNTQVKRGLALLRSDLETHRGRDGTRSLLGLALMPVLARRSRLLPLATAGTFLAASAVLMVVFGGGRSVRAEDAAGPEVELASAPAPDEVPAPRARAALEPPATEPLPVESLLDEIASPTGPLLEALVVDAEGDPVPGARVFVRLGGGWSERGSTDAAGRIELELDEESDLGVGAIPPGLVHVRAAAAGLATVKESIFDVLGSEERSLTIRLGSTEARLSARIVDPDGFGIDGADVVVMPANIPTGTSEDGVMLRVARHEAVTDEDGHFELGHLPGESMQVHMHHPDLGVFTAGVELDPGELVQTELTFTPGGVIEGVVVDEAGTALEGATLRAVWPGPVALPPAWINTTTDGDGRFSLAVPAAPRSELWVRGPDGPRLQACELVNVRAGSWHDLELEVRAWPPVRVRLLDGDGEPLAGWLLSMRPTEPGDVRYTAGMTAADGRTELTLPFEGKLRVDVLGEMMDRSESVVHTLLDVEPDPLIEHEIVLDLEGPLRARVTGTLVPEGWTPPADLLLVFELQPTGNNVRGPVAGDLSFDVDTLGPGTYSIRVRGGDTLQAVIGEVEVEAGETLDLGVIELASPGRLDLSRIADTRILELVQFGSHPLPTQIWRGRGGLATALELLPGSYSLRHHPTPDSTAEVRFEVSAGANLQFSPTLELR